MERELIPRSSSRDIRVHQSGQIASKSRATTRSRSPSADPRGVGIRSERRHRERSWPRSRSKRKRAARGDADHCDGDEALRHKRRRSRSGQHHWRRHRDDATDSDRHHDRVGRKDEELPRPPHRSHNDERRRRSPSPKLDDHWDDRHATSRSMSRYRSSHQCSDSTLNLNDVGCGTKPPALTTSDGRTIRLPPPETERHYTSHRCHHYSHRDSPFRSSTPRSHHRGHTPKRCSPPPQREEQSSLEQPLLPYGARALSRWDFAAFEPLFAHYLEKHKHLNMADLDEESLRVRWKSFVWKWNAGELDKTWYEPEMSLRVVRLRAQDDATARAVTAVQVAASGKPSVMSPPLTRGSFVTRDVMDSVIADATGGSSGVAYAMEEDDDDEDEYAPPLPPPQQPSTITQPATSTTTTTSTAKPGPAIPTLSDLELRRILDSEAREASISSLRLSRRADRAVQKERLDDLLPPRAEAGTRERQLEKRRLTTEAMREFANSKETGGGEAMEMPDSELLGAGGDAGDDYRRMLEGMRHRRTEREVRREEERRARNVERDERIREARAREEERLGVLREMARSRFG